MSTPQKTALEINWKKNLFFVWLSQFLSLAGFGCCMPFIPLLLKDNLGVTDPRMQGLYVSIYYFAGMLSLCFASIFWGILADKFGRKIMLLRASYGAAIFYPLLAFAPNVAVLILIRFICSFFSGTVNPAQTLLVTTTPPNKHGFVLGTISTATTSGNMLGYMAGGFIVEYWGYTAAFLICGAVYLISGILIHIFVKENFQRPVKKPEELEKTQKVSKWESFKAQATTAIVWLLILFLVSGVARRIEQPFLAMQVLAINGPEKAALYTGWISAAAALGGVISGVLFGQLCDKFPPRKLLIPTLILSVIAHLIQAWAPSIAIFMLSRFFCFLVAGGIHPALQVLLSKVVPVEKKGTFFGWSQSVSTIGGIICAVITGSLSCLSDDNARWIFTMPALLFLIMIPLMLPAIKACMKEFICDPDATGKDLKKAS